jgi:hypothetical protein
VGAQVEALLERHIGTNTCPICYELMAGKVHQPTLLFPCGHTFCASCLQTHVEKLGRKNCPYCREVVASQAPNISLQQVIEGFVERQEALARGEVLPELVQAQEAVANAAAYRQQQRPGSERLDHGAGGGGAGGGIAPARTAGTGEAEQYAEQYRAYSMRCRVMHNQLLDSRAEADGFREKRRTAEAVLAHLSGEEEAAAQRLEEARLELEVVRAQRAEQAAKCEQVRPVPKLLPKLSPAESLGCDCHRPRAISPLHMHNARVYVHAGGGSAGGDCSNGRDCWRDPSFARG